MSAANGYSTSADVTGEKGYKEVVLPDGTEAYSCIEYRGRKFPTFGSGFIDRMEDFKENFKSRSDDILIYGYMKSGTHWVWEIIRMLLENTTEVSATRNKAQSFIECQTNPKFEELASPRILSTHLMLPELPEDIVNSRIVIPVRNPKDVAVSLYHHLVAEKQGTNLRCGWDKYASEVFLSQDYAVYYPWTEYAADTWSRCLENENFHPVIYEQLLENPVEIIRDLASFLKISVTDEFLHDVAKATMFDQMKPIKIQTEDFLNSAFTVGYTMYRKGINGDWRNHFTEEQAAIFDKKIEDACANNKSLRHLMMLYN